MTDVGYCDFPPQTSIIESIIRERFSLRVLLAELIDNALDKRAMTIRIYRRDDELIVEDNGAGVSDMRALLQWGRHSKAEGSRTMGRFGIGLKHAAIWLAEGMEVQTRHRNHRYSLSVEWAQIIESGRWRTLLPAPIADAGESYTHFSFGPLRPSRYKNIGGCEKVLSYEYTPALQRGVVIALDDYTLQPVPLPPLESMVELDQDLHGRHFRLKAGLKVKGTAPDRHGVDVAYLDRIILQGDCYGLKDYSPQHFYAYLELLDDWDSKWTMSTHKNYFEQRDDLYEYLFPYIEPLLQAADERGDIIELDGIRDKALEALASIKRIREKRKRGAATGTAQPTNDGKQRENAKKTDPNAPGSVLDRLHGVLDLRFDCHDPNKIGEVQETKTATIISLNPEFEVIRTREVGAVIVVALGLLSAHVIRNPERRNKFGVPAFPEFAAEGFYDEFVQILTNLIQRAALNKEKKEAAV